MLIWGVYRGLACPTRGIRSGRPTDLCMPWFVLVLRCCSGWMAVTKFAPGAFGAFLWWRLKLWCVVMGTVPIPRIPRPRHRWLAPLANPLPGTAGCVDATARLAAAPLGA